MRSWNPPRHLIKIMSSRHLSRVNLLSAYGAQQACIKALGNRGCKGSNPTTNLTQPSTSLTSFRSYTMHHFWPTSLF